jgi:hypothetical protein
MYSPDELKSLHGFVKQTGEGNLKKMMMGGAMTDVHVNMLVKCVRACSEDEFVTHWEASSFPKVKFSPAERAIQEKCYGVWADACSKLGLLPAAGKKAA